MKNKESKNKEKQNDGVSVKDVKESIKSNYILNIAWLMLFVVGYFGGFLTVVVWIWGIISGIQILATLYISEAIKSNEFREKIINNPALKKGTITVMFTNYFHNIFLASLYLIVFGYFGLWWLFAIEWFRLGVIAYFRNNLNKYFMIS
jgi:hypothetical protein